MGGANGGSGGSAGMGGSNAAGGSFGRSAGGTNGGAGGSSTGMGGFSGTGGSSTGMGGSAGVGGSSGMGGAPGMGGSTGMGGSSGVGGSSGMGGSSGVGGSTGMGGSFGTGGSSCGSSVVISQVWGGGTTSPAYARDFIELHNRGRTQVLVDGWSVQYAGSTGSSWQATILTGAIAPGGYYLVALASHTSGMNLPTPNAYGSTNIGTTAGKVALRRSTGTLNGECPLATTDLIDLVGFGSGTTCSEGTVSPSPSMTHAIFRRGSGATSACQDTQDNGADFMSAPAAPRNSTSPAVTCCP
jgi:hypothetical protein